MTNGIDIAKKNELYALIRIVGTAYGEDIEFLRTYAVEQAKAWAHDLDAAIACFRDLKESRILMGKLKREQEEISKTAPMPCKSRYQKWNR